MGWKITMALLAISPPSAAIWALASLLHVVSVDTSRKCYPALLMMFVVTPVLMETYKGRQRRASTNQRTLAGGR
jgi:predicted DNA-binding ArsR family transcriptional regulator